MPDPSLYLLNIDCCSAFSGDLLVDGEDSNGWALGWVVGTLRFELPLPARLLARLVLSMTTSYCIGECGASGRGVDYRSICLIHLTDAKIPAWVLCLLEISSSNVKGKMHGTRLLTQKIFMHVTRVLLPLGRSR